MHLLSSGRLNCFILPKILRMKQKDVLFKNKTSLNIRGHLIDLSSPKVMGILNVTPDSFYAGSRVADEKSLLNQAEQMLQEGATFLDIGGYSSRPGAKDISEKEEIERVIPAIKSVIKAFPEAIISVDTFRSDVAEMAIEHGASMVNDISGGELDLGMTSTVLKSGLPYVVMHMPGNPQTMQKNTNYTDVFEEVFNFLVHKVEDLQQKGINDIIIDPGFGFGKTIEQSYELLNKLECFRIIGVPILVGFSRKSMIWKLLETDPQKALNGTTILNTVAIMKGASILRVHDVKPAMEILKLGAHLETI